MNYYIGIDTAKGQARYQVEDTHTQIVRKGRLKANHWSMKQFLLQLERLGVLPADTLIGIEATGLLHIGWCVALSQAGYRVLALNPLLSKRRYTPENAIRDHKTDPVDAAGLCDIIRRDGHKLQRFLYQHQPERFALKRLLSVRKVLRSSLTNLYKASGDLLDFIFPELRPMGLTLTHQGLRRLLKRHSTAQAIAALPKATLKRYVADKSTLLKEAAEHSFATAELAQCSVPALREFIVNIEQLSERLLQVDKQIDQFLATAVPAEQVTLAPSLPAFGAKTSPAVLAFIPEDYARWGSKKKITAKLQALFGTEPRMRRSGKWIGKEKMSKRGVELARTALFQIAFCSLLHDPQCRSYYDSLRARGKSHKEAIVNLMRKHLRRLVSVLVEQNPYTPVLSENVAIST